MAHGIDQTSYHTGTRELKEEKVFVYEVEVTKVSSSHWESIAPRKFGSRMYHGTYCSVSRYLKNGMKITRKMTLVGAPTSFIKSHNLVQTYDL